MTDSLQKKLLRIAHCPKQVVHDNPVYDCNFDSDCDKCPNRNHSLCTTLVQEAVRDIASTVRKKKIKVDKLPNPNEQVTMTKKEWAKEFNREVDEIIELLVGSSPSVVVK